MLFRINSELLVFYPDRMHISKWVTISKVSLRKTIVKVNISNSKSLGNIFISKKLGLAYFPYYRLPPSEIVKRAENPRKLAIVQAPLKDTAIVAVGDYWPDRGADFCQPFTKYI